MTTARVKQYCSQKTNKLELQICIERIEDMRENIMKLNKYFLIGLLLGFSVNVCAANKDTKDDALPKPDFGIFEEMKVHPGKHRHHLLPADSLKNAGYNSNNGVSVVMTPERHRKTASYGGGKEAAQFRKQVTDSLCEEDFSAAADLVVGDLKNVTADTSKYASPIRHVYNMIRDAIVEDGKIIWGNP